MSRFFPTLLLLLGAFTPAAAQAYTFLSVSQCSSGEYPLWTGGPIRWYLQEDGAPGLSIEDVETILKRSFETWAEPCCSGVRAEYQGLTAEKHAPGKIIFSFERIAWPAEVGNRGLAAGTTRRVPSGCGLDSALIVFNAMNYRFTLPGGAWAQDEIDLELIAVHEIGHLLGIGHSERPDVIMSAMIPGYEFNGIFDDDIAAVCALYPGSCEPCTTHGSCPKGSVCIEGGCVTAECRASSDCLGQQVCEEGVCMGAPCTEHASCGESERCAAGRCAETCGGKICPEGGRCEEGTCVGGSVPPAKEGGCAQAGGAASWGVLLAALLWGLAPRRRPLGSLE